MGNLGEGKEGQEEKPKLVKKLNQVMKEEEEMVEECWRTWNSYWKA